MQKTARLRQAGGFSHSTRLKKPSHGKRFDRFMRFLTCAKPECIRCAVCKYTHQLSRILFRDAKAAKKVREGTDDVLYSQIPLQILMGKNQNPCCPICRRPALVVGS
jgi:hypothetical protein